MVRVPPNHKAVTAATLLGFLVLGVFLRAGELRVDINRDLNNTERATETGYCRWSPDASNGAASGTDPVRGEFVTDTAERVVVTFAQTAASAAAGGAGLATGWHKAGAEGAARLVGDGLTVAPADFGGGGQIRMTVSGLAAGSHTMLTYHNTWESAAPGSWASMAISVNGKPALARLQPTIRAAANDLAATAYLTFMTKSAADVTEIVFAAEMQSGAGVRVRNVVINGFEIDTPDPSKSAWGPVPCYGDDHVDGDDGTVALSWQPSRSGGLVSHDVYFGTDRQAVKAANRRSPQFLGNQTATTRTVRLPEKLARYFWRVDEIEASGRTTVGAVWMFRPRVSAFPGSEGYGRYARGGRGGRVVHVVSLDDYDGKEKPVPGTLRHAIEVEEGPRVIVFDVAGLITLRSRLTLADPCVTVAAQTAPGKGICLRGWALGLSGANDSIVRFLRNRPGNISGQTLDGGGLAGCDHSIMDHCSISWSIDEGFSSRNARNITLQRTLISEALNIAGHNKKPAGNAHGFAATIGGDKGSFHHNLLAHCEGRNWSLGGGLDAEGNFAGRLDIRNNVVYNWRGRTTDGGACEVNFVNNYYQPGPATKHVPFALTMNHENEAGGSQRCYFVGNLMRGHFDESNQSAGRRSVVSNGVKPPSYETFVSAPFFESLVTTESARAAYPDVLSDVGANQPLDEHDKRVLNETLIGTCKFTGTGPYGGYPGLPNSQDDVGGWEDYPTETRPAGWDTDGDGLPDWWERLHQTNPRSPAGDFSDSSADPDNDGDTRLCDYLNWLSRPHFETLSNTPADIDLAALGAGFGPAAKYEIQLDPNQTTAGSVRLSDNGRMARFAPAAGFSGLVRLGLRITDSAGNAGTREIGIAVRPAIKP